MKLFQLAEFTRILDGITREGCGRFRMKYADLAAHIHGATLRG
ncbi:hypothetical protein WME90_47490 [Sorangium sp. So ce375]